MFKGFQSKSRQFNGFPNLNFQVNNEAYGFSGCTFWLDAAYGTNTQTNGAAITKWDSKIGSYFASQNTAVNQPIYVSSDVNFNNLPSINFNGYLTKRMDINLHTNNRNEMTLAIVLKSDNVSNTRHCVLQNSLAITGGEIVTGGTQAGYSGLGLQSAATSILTSTIEDTASHIFCMTNNELYIDGISRATGLWNGSNSWNRIGGDFGTYGSIVGRIAEIIIWNRFIDLLSISDRLNTKYAIY